MGGGGSRYGKTNYQKMSLVTIGIILVENVFHMSYKLAVIYVYKEKTPSEVSYETLI